MAMMTSVNPLKIFKHPGMWHATAYSKLWVFPEMRKLLLNSASKSSKLLFNVNPESGMVLNRTIQELDARNS